MRETCAELVSVFKSKHSLQETKPTKRERKDSLAGTGTDVDSMFRVGFYIYSPILAFLAILFGFLALRKINNSKDKLRGKGKAVAGITIGIISILFTLSLLFSKEKP